MTRPAWNPTPGQEIIDPVTDRVGRMVVRNNQAADEILVRWADRTESWTPTTRLDPYPKGSS